MTGGWGVRELFMEEYVQKLEHKGQTSTLNSKQSPVSQSPLLHQGRQRS